jgi:hypothetical protein
MLNVKASFGSVHMSGVALIPAHTQFPFSKCSARVQFLMQLCFASPACSGWKMDLISNFIS